MKPLKDLVARAKECLAGKSRSHVQDSLDFAEVLLLLESALDAKAMYDNLTATQTRCTELIQSVRAGALPRDGRQKRVLDWARDTFGDVAMKPKERARRFIEEAIELAQSAGLTCSDVSDICVHVYAKPKGDPALEVGGVSVTLLAYCETMSISADAQEALEIGRVTSKDKSFWRERQNKKAAAGIGEKA